MLSHMSKSASSALILLLVLLGRPSWAAPETILAKVNGAPITSHDLEIESALINADLNLRSRQMSREQIGAMRGQVLETLVERELLYQEAQKNHITVLPQEVESALAELQSELGGSAGLQAYLAAGGQNQGKLRERLRRGMAVQRLLFKEVTRKISVSEAEMGAYYSRHPEFFETGEQLRVRHILAAVKSWADEGQCAEARNKLLSLKARISGGEDFSALAFQYSDCSSKSRGGDLGYLTREQMVQPFADAAAGLAVGEVSDPVMTNSGYHLIQVVDRTPSVHIRYNEARAKIERTLRRNKQNAAITRYMSLLKSRAAVERVGVLP